jgi:hypothetical protein
MEDDRVLGLSPVSFRPLFLLGVEWDRMCAKIQVKLVCDVD